jgi:hypothetical protein
MEYREESTMNEQRAVKQSTEAVNHGRPRGITIVAVLMILFGLAEVVTGFTHNFFGIITSSINIFTYSAAAIGAFYVVGGLLILTMKKWAAALAIVLLVADIVGRVSLVVTGLYPLNSRRRHGHRGRLRHLHRIEVETLQVNRTDP